MEINQKKLEKIKNQIKKQDMRNLKNYQKNGYEGFLILLNLKDKNPQTVAEYYEISLEEAAELIKKQDELSEKEAQENELCEKALEIAQKNDNSLPDEQTLCEKLRISPEKANSLIWKMHINAVLAPVFAPLHELTSSMQELVNTYNQNKEIHFRIQSESVDEKM